MRGAPWEGLFYGFVVEVVVAIGASVYALQTPDFLARALAWGLFGGVLVLAVRTIRRAARRPAEPDHPTGRWWFGG
jgi:hypothetical protein